MSSNPNRAKVAEFHRAFKVQTEPESFSIPALPPADEEDRLDFGDIARELRRSAHHAHTSAELVKSGQEGPEGEKRHVAFLRLQLMIEEMAEVAEALGMHDLTEVAHEMADLDYVVQGTVLAFGLDGTHEPCVAEIHRANMSKLGHNGEPILNEAGRVVKGPDFRKACVRDILMAHLKSEDAA